MRGVSGRRKPHAEGRSKAVIKSAQRQPTAAGLYVSVRRAVVREGRGRDWPGVSKSLDEVWRPFRWPRPEVSREELAGVCGSLREAERRWHELPAGHSMTVTWRAS